MLSKYRKAVAALILPLLGLPVANWVSGVEMFSWQVFFASLMTGFVAAVGVYFAPNEV